MLNITYSVSQIYVYDYYDVGSLVDVKECYESPFLILGAPVAGSSMYTVAYQVDDNGRETLIALARASGLSGNHPACSTCTNDGEDGLLQGFRAEVVGIVTDSISDPPVLTVSSASVSNGRAATDICVLQQSSAPPTRSPQTEPPVSNPTSIILPTARPITTKPSTSAPIATLPSSAPSLSTNSQESFFPTFDAPTTEPMDVQLTEKPSQIESLVPSYEPTSRPNSTPVSFPNTTTNTAPTPTTTGSQNVVTNTGSTSSADSIPTSSYAYIIWLSLQNVLWLAPLLALC